MMLIIMKIRMGSSICLRQGVEMVQPPPPFFNCQRLFMAFHAIKVAGNAIYTPWLVDGNDIAISRGKSVRISMAVGAN